MTAVYDKNMAAIREVFPDLAKWIEDAPDQDWLRRDGDQLYIRELATGRMTPMYGSDPLAEARLLDKTVKLHRENVTVVVGLGLGHAVARIVETMEKGHHVIIVEPVGHVIRLALGRHDLSAAVRDRALVFAPGDAEVDYAVSFLESVKVVQDWGVLVDATCRRRPEYSRAVEHAVDVLNQVQCNNGTMISAGAKIADNDIATLPYVIRYRGVAELAGLFAGKPAVMVGTGPSLARNIHVLREARDRVVVVAVAQALRPLLAYDIRPDFICTVDFGEVNMTHLDGLMDADVPLVTINKAYAPLLRAYRGPKFVSASASPEFAGTSHGILGHRGQLAQGGSVAHMAFALAVNLGCSPIAFVGMDLALGETSHFPLADSAGAISVVDGQIKWKVDDPRSHTLYGKDLGMGPAAYVDGWWGKPVLTNTGLMSFITAMERLVAQCQAPVYDCTEGGSRKKGTRRRLLSDFLAEHARLPIDKSVVAPLLTLDPDGDALIDKLMPMLDDDLVALDEIIENADAGLRVAAKARKTSDPQRLIKLFTQNDKYSRAAHAATKKMPTVTTAIYWASRKIASRELNVEKDARRLVTNKKDRLTRIELNETILQAARTASTELKKTYEDVRQVFRRYRDGDREVLDPVGETRPPSVDDAETMLAAGNFAKPLLDARRILLTLNLSSTAAETRRAREVWHAALDLRKAKIAEAEAMQAQADPGEPRFLDLVDSAQAAGRDRQDYFEALLCLEEAAALRPADVNARWGVASAHNMLGDLAAARQHYEALVRDFPDRPRLRFELGQVMIKQWRDADGRPELLRAVELIAGAMQESQEFDHFLLVFAAVLKRAGQEDRAREALAAYQQKFPGDPDADWEKL